MKSCQCLLVRGSLGIAAWSEYPSYMVAGNDIAHSPIQNDVRNLWLGRDGMVRAQGFNMTGKSLATRPGLASSGRDDRQPRGCRDAAQTGQECR